MSQFVVVIKRSIRFILDLICCILEWFYADQYGYLPPITNPLLLESATSLSTKIKTGKIKSEHVVQAYIDRIGQVQPHINAIIDNRFEEALNEARQLDQQIEEQLSRNGKLDQSLQSKPFLGIPYSGKDSIAIKGLRFTSGIPDRKDTKAEVDSTFAELWRSAGAIPLCMSNVPELLLWWDTVNKSFGRTNNPYNKSLIPGGSTGGNASLISSAGSLLGMASDIGGSVRIPANFCGVYGHCCSVETVPLDNQWPPYVESRKKLVSWGPLTRYAADLRQMVKICTSKSEESLQIDKDVDVKNMKVYYITQFDDPSLTPVHEDVKQSIRIAAKHLQSLGATVREVKLTHMKDPFNIWMTKMSTDDVSQMPYEMTNRKGKVNLWLELIRCLLGMSPHTLIVIFTGIFQQLSATFGSNKSFYLKQHELLKKEIDQLLGDDGILLAPSHPEVGVKPISCLLKFKNTSYTGVFNTLRVCMTQIPLGLNPKGLPIGMQAISAHLNDHLPLKVAELLDKEFGGWVAPTEIKAK